jgi:phage N-6-adenine-methyltransferase
MSAEQRDEQAPTALDAKRARRWSKGDVVDDRATHPLDFAAFTERHGPFTLDVAAAPHNTKCERFFTREQDGLARDWSGERVWCNPPYSDIAPWVRKAWDCWASTSGISMLLPASRTEQQWWQLMVEPYRDRAGSPLSVEFLPGRMRFLRPGRTHIGPGERPPFGCVLLTWTVGADATFVYHPDRIPADALFAGEQPFRPAGGDDRG